VSTTSEIIMARAAMIATRSPIPMGLAWFIAY
jgi:hypothetical protein